MAVEGSRGGAQGRRGGRRCGEFSWDGDDDGDRASGRGWAVLEQDGSLRGHIYFHLGDDSSFRARRAEEQDPRDEARPVRATGLIRGGARLGREPPSPDERID